ncbi:cysteine desulfurase family protein [Nanoarchaeota archaeon]
MKIYLDNAATTKMDESVVKAMSPYFTDKFGNPSSSHWLGQEAKRDLEEARDVIAKAIGADRKEIVFTSGGTESNNFTIKGIAFENKGKGNHIITTKIEHDCVLNACKWLETQGFNITYLDVDSEGFISSEDLEKAITPKTILVSIIHGNNEIGTIQDLKALGDVCKKHNVLFHTDACQSFTKTELNVKKQNLDLITLNAHKIHGPKGVGVLYVKKGTKISPLSHGGGQEFGLRSGTENVPGAVGFAKSVKNSNSKDVKKMTELRDRLIKAVLEIPDTRLNGSKGEERLCNNCNFSFKYIEGEAIGSFLDGAGIQSSTGSACSSKSLEPSHVLIALGLKEEDAHGSLRLSLSKHTTEQEIDYVIEKLKKTVERLRKISPLGKSE